MALGFVAEADGAILVAATEEASAWARNLEAEPRCTVVIGERRVAAVAQALERPDHIHAVRELILRYGTPSEGLGRGPSFRLRPSVTD